MRGTEIGAGGVCRRPFRITAGLLLVALANGCTPSNAADAVAGGTLAPVDYGLAPSARERWLPHVDSLQLALASLGEAARRLDGRPTTQRAAETHFRAARAQWKRVEFIAEYYEPSTSKAINGPAITEVEEEEGPEILDYPEGFQVIEQLLFPVADPTRRDSLAMEVETLVEHVTRLRTAMAAQRLTDSRVFEAAKYEIARLAALGITGYDSPVAQQSLTETAAALDGMREAISTYTGAIDTRRAGLGARLDSAFAAARDVVADGSVTFETFDRFGFIATHLHPLAHRLDSARVALALDAPTARAPFRAGAASVFDRDAFDAYGFAAPGTPRATPAQVALGDALFRDARLSGDGSRACSACHDPSRAFVDGQPKSAALDGGRVARNAPTIINSGLQVGAFADLRTTFLEDQVADVVANASEMHGNLDATATRLARDTAFVRAYRAAYPAEAHVTAARLQHAIASFLRSAQALSSRVDRAIRGTDSLTREERLGFNVFAGKGKCATCHFLPLTNGTVPPAYQRTDVEVIGVPAAPTWRTARIDADSGRAGITKAPLHLHAFRTPSVRNVALTAPYMHNGVYRTLDDVVEFYDRGGGAGIGIRLDHQTLPPEPLRLSAAEKRALVAFMRALTDTTVTTPR